MMGKRKDSTFRRATLVNPSPAGHYLRRLVTEDRGMTLTEMLVSAFLMSLLIGVLGTAFYQFFTATRWGNDALTALHDLENAEVWLSRDAREARSFTPGASPVYGTFDCGDSTVQYRYSYDPSRTALVREKMVNGVVESTLVVARHIAQQGDVAFSVARSLVTITLKSTKININMRAYEEG